MGHVLGLEAGRDLGGGVALDHLGDHVGHDLGVLHALADRAETRILDHVGAADGAAGGVEFVVGQGKHRDEAVLRGADRIEACEVG